MKAKRLVQLAVVAIFAATTLGLANPANAFVKIAGADDDYFLKLGLLVKPTLEVSHSQKTDTTMFDAYLRRARILFAGQVSKWVSFFVETEQYKWGKGGDWNNPFFVQDAFVTFELHELAKVSVGMLLVSPNRHFRQSAVSLSTLDYHAIPAKFPSGKVWRDMGIEIRGLALGQKIDYRFAITNGNPGAYEDVPRFTGRLGFNFMDAEPGFFFGGNYLGKKKLLSLGVGFDVQPITKDETFYTISADLGWSLPFVGGNNLSGNLGVLYYGEDNGLFAPFVNAASGTAAAAASPAGGLGFFFDVGYAIGKFQPTLVYDMFIPVDVKGDLVDKMDDMRVFMGFGLAYWLMGHNCNIKLQVGVDKAEGDKFEDAGITTILQTQLFI